MELFPGLNLIIGVNWRLTSRNGMFINIIIVFLHLRGMHSKPLQKTPEASDGSGPYIQVLCCLMPIDLIVKMAPK